MEYQAVATGMYPEKDISHVIFDREVKEELVTAHQSGKALPAGGAGRTSCISVDSIRTLRTKETFHDQIP